MMKTIVFSEEAARDLQALPPNARTQIEDALYAYAVFQRGDVKRLSGRAGYRLRSGRYRIIFDEDSVTILAVYVGKRETTTYSRH